MESRAIAALLGSLASRRDAVSLLGGGLLGTQAGRLTIEDAEARKKGRRKKKRKNNSKKEPKVRAAATCPGSGLLASGAENGNSRVAQTFVALASGPLVKARLAMLSGLESTGDFELRLAEVDGAGLPTDDVLAVSTVASDRVPNERSDIDFAFAKPFAVKAGIEYALVLTRPGGGQFAWFGEDERRCPGDPFFSPDQATPLAPIAVVTFDHTYTVFVRS
jgi:hypothetical protein